MTTENLIRRLVNQNRAVKPLASPQLRVCGWIAFALLCVIIGVVTIQPRKDWPAALLDPIFLLQLAIPLALSFVAAIAAFRLSVPGQDLLSVRILTGLIAVIWAASLIYLSLSAQHSHAGIGWNCLRNILLLSLVPGVILAWMLKKAAPLQFGQTGLFAALSAAALSCAGTRFICPNETSTHFFLWHCLPTLGLSYAGLLLGKKIFK